MNTRFKAAMRAFEERDPVLAEAVAKAGPGAWTACETREGEANLRKGDLILHSGYSARRESERWRSELTLEGVQVVYIYGVGLGYSFQQLRGWLAESPQRYLVYFEEDLSVLYHLLGSEVGAELVAHQQVMLVSVMGTEEERQEIAQELAYYYVGLTPLITALPAYEKALTARYDRMRMHVMHASAYVGFAGQEFMDFGAQFFRNFHLNMLRLPEASSAARLFGAFEGVPAIICGAGPSLNQHLDLLRGLGDRALIFAGGSAINALLQNGIQPHFGASVDPNPIQAQRMHTHDGFELPIFYKTRIHYRALETLHGPHLYLAGATGYPVVRWMEKQLGIDEEQAIEGHNCLHLLIDVARRMGCNPLIFVGMDLAYTGLHQYAQGVVEGNALTREQITKQTNLNDNAFERKDIYGRPVYTLWKWVAESDYTANYAKQHPETTFLNATEGGLGFEGIRNVKLSEVVAAHLQKRRDLKTEVTQAIERNRYRNFDLPDVVARLQELDRSLVRTVELCGEMIERFDELEKLIKKVKKSTAGKVEKINTQLLELRRQLSDQVACRELVEPVNHVRTIIFERRLNEVEHDKRKRSDLERTLDHLGASKDEIKSLRDCAHYNHLIFEASFRDWEEQGYKLDQRRPEHPAAPVRREGDRVQLFYPNGQLKREIHYRDGKRHGTERCWNYGGTLTSEREYDRGRVVHEKHWTQKGVLVEERRHRESGRPSDVVKWDENGTKRLEILAEEGHRSVREWDVTGQLRREETLPYTPASTGAGGREENLKHP